MSPPGINKKPQLPVPKRAMHNAPASAPQPRTVPAEQSKVWSQGVTLPNGLTLTPEQVAQVGTPDGHIDEAKLFQLLGAQKPEMQGVSLQDAYDRIGAKPEAPVKPSADSMESFNRLMQVHSVFEDFKSAATDGNGKFRRMADGKTSQFLEASGMALGLEASTLAPGTKDSVDPDEVKLAFAKASSLRTEAKAAHFEDTPVRGALTDRALEYAQKTNVQEKLATAVAARRALDRAAPGSVEKAAREHELQGAMQMLTAEIDKAKLLDKLTEKLTSGEHIPESFGAEVAAARNAIGARQDDADKELAAAGKLRGKHSQRAAEVEVGVQNLLGMFTPKGAVPSTTTADVAKEGEDPDAIWARMQNDGVRFARADVSPQIASTARYQGATSTNIRHDLSLMTDVLSSQRKEFEALTQKLEAILSKLDGVI